MVYFTNTETLREGRLVPGAVYIPLDAQLRPLCSRCYPGIGLGSNPPPQALMLVGGLVEAYLQSLSPNSRSSWPAKPLRSPAGGLRPARRLSDQMRQEFGCLEDVVVCETRWLLDPPQLVPATLRMSCLYRGWGGNLRRWDPDQNPVTLVTMVFS